jgi:Nif-specific ferredoxin III
MQATQSAVQSFTRDGRVWNPSYLQAINADACIGCGRCFKVCGRSVMTLQGFTEDGNIVSLEDDEEILRKVMTVTDAGDCIGCGSCTRICAKKCQMHETS